MKKLLLFFASFLICSPLFAQNLIPNGDFESNFDSWTAVGSVALTSAMPNSGAMAMQVSDSAKNSYSYAWQALSLDYDKHEVTFWFLPESPSYFSAFELIANWQDGTAKFITRVLLRDSTLAFTALDQTEVIANPMTHGAWNKVSILVNKSTLQQMFYVNDRLASTLASSEFPTIEHLLVGDLSITGMWGTAFFDNISIVEATTTSVATPARSIDGFALHPNYPNPFNPSTVIGFDLAAETHLRLQVFNARGRMIRQVLNGRRGQGSHTVRWDGRDLAGKSVTSGVYIARLVADGFSQSRKMLLMR